MTKFRWLNRHYHFYHNPFNVWIFPHNDQHDCVVKFGDYSDDFVVSGTIDDAKEAVKDWMVNQYLETANFLLGVNK